jgi:hypothetical protein
MRTAAPLFAAALLESFSCLANPEPELSTDAPPTSARSVSFYETLAPHGEWLIVTPFGRVWRPNPKLVGADFHPYLTGGGWAHSPLGWIFESRWAWGWLPFHYGRWYQDQIDGWLWVPDSQWAPAWVDWRYGGGFVGWSPRPPENSNLAGPIESPWYFVPSKNFVQPQVEHFRLRAEATRPILSVTQPTAQGPAPERLQNEISIPVPRRKLSTPPAPLPRSAGIFPDGLRAPRPVHGAQPISPPLPRPVRAAPTADQLP